MHTLTNSHARDAVVSVKGANIHYFDRGEGELLLCLHGNPDSASMWLPAIQRLAKRYRCVAPDLPGFGLSDVYPGYDYGLAGFADFVDQFLTAIGHTTAVNLLVHDFGGVCGLSWARLHAHRVERVFITNTIFQPDYQWHFWGRVWRTPLLGELSAILMSRLLFNLELRRGSVALTKETRAEMYALISKKMKQTVLKTYRAIDPENFTGADQQWLAVASRRPVHVLWGENDPYIPLSFAHRFGGRDVEVLEKCGHWVASERPAELAAFVLARS